MFQISLQSGRAARSTKWQHFVSEVGSGVSNFNAWFPTSSNATSVDCIGGGCSDLSSAVFRIRTAPDDTGIVSTAIVLAHEI